MRRVSPKGQSWQAWATVRIIRGPMGYGIAAQRKSIGRGHNSLSLARQSSLVIRQPVTHAKRAGAGSASVRMRRPGPAHRPGFVTGCAALAGLGFGVTVGTVLIGEDRGSLDNDQIGRAHV